MKSELVPAYLDAITLRNDVDETVLKDFSRLEEAAPRIAFEINGD